MLFFIDLLLKRVEGSGTVDATWCLHRLIASHHPSFDCNTHTHSHSHIQAHTLRPYHGSNTSLTNRHRSMVISSRCELLLSHTYACWFVHSLIVASTQTFAFTCERELLRGGCLSSSSRSYQRIEEGLAPRSYLLF